MKTHAPIVAFGGERSREDDQHIEAQIRQEAEDKYAGRLTSPSALLRLFTRVKVWHEINTHLEQPRSPHCLYQAVE